MKLTNAIQGAEPRVLVVEDCEDNQFLIGLHLQMNQIQFACAGDGQEAVRRVRDEHFDVVLMDLRMPRMNGDVAVRLMREQGYQGPVLALTGNTSATERAHCLEAGFNEHLSKPIDFTQLVQAVRKHLSRPAPEASA